MQCLPEVEQRYSQDRRKIQTKVLNHTLEGFILIQIYYLVSIEQQQEPAQVSTKFVIPLSLFQQS